MIGSRRPHAGAAALRVIDGKAQAIVPSQRRATGIPSTRLGRSWSAASPAQGCSAATPPGSVRTRAERPSVRLFIVSAPLCVHPGSAVNPHLSCRHPDVVACRRSASLCRPSSWPHRQRDEQSSARTGGSSQSGKIAQVIKFDHQHVGDHVMRQLGHHHPFAVPLVPRVEVQAVLRPDAGVLPEAIRVAQREPKGFAELADRTTGLIVGLDGKREPGEAKATGPQRPAPVGASR